MIKENGWDWSVSSRICNWDNTMLLHSRRRAYNDIECESGEPHEEWNRHTKSFFLFLFLQIIKHDWFFVRPYSRQVIKSLVQTSRFQWLPFHDHCTFIKSFDLNINSVLISNWIGIFDSVIQLWPFMGRNSFFFSSSFICFDDLYSEWALYVYRHKHLTPTGMELHEKNLINIAICISIPVVVIYYLFNSNND